MVKIQRYKILKNTIDVRHIVNDILWEMNAKNGEYFETINNNEKKKRIYKSTKMNYLVSIFGKKKIRERTNKRNVLNF